MFSAVNRGWLKGRWGLKLVGFRFFQILNATALDGVVAYINQKGCKHIITMSGAGISTCKYQYFCVYLESKSYAGAGIPDFRSPGTGLYYNLQKYNLPSPEAIFHLPFFRKNPKPFFVLAKKLFPGGFKPTACHYFIRLLHENNMLLRHYTQNIDSLERVAGIPEEKLVEAHGTCYTGHCLTCREKYDLSWMKGWQGFFSITFPIQRGFQNKSSRMKSQFA